MKIFLFILPFLGFTRASAQSFTVTIDGSHRTTLDSIDLMGQEFEIERVVFYRTLPVRPGKTTTKTLSIPAPIVLQVGETEFLACGGDSIHLSYDRQDKKYRIDGGRYTGNYRLYSMLSAMRYPRDLFRTADDNYEEYVRSVDSVSGHAMSLIKEEREKGSLSSDASDYMTAFIKYRHLTELMTLPSKTAQALLPVTHSSLFPTVTPEDFHKDQYAGMMAYIFCARTYVRNRMRLTEEVRKDQMARNIAYAIDSLSGGTRERVLYSFIVPSGYKGNGDKSALTALFDRIRALQLPAYYSTAIEKQYKKDMLEEEPLDAGLLTQALLKTSDGKAVSLQSILDTSREEKIFIQFREYGIDVKYSGSIPGEPITTEKPRVINVYLNGSVQNWQKYCKKQGIRTDEYYLSGGLKNPLAAYLLISRLPAWVALNRSGKIENIDLTLPDMFRYNLTSFNK